MRGVSFRVSFHFRSHAASNTRMELVTSGIPSLEIFCLVVKPGHSGIRSSFRCETPHLNVSSVRT